MSQSLSIVETHAWQQLQGSPTDTGSAWRHLTFCSIDSAARPQARMLILRQADLATRELEFHTDVRSDKWHELAGNSAVTVVGYDVEARLQIRLNGTALRHGPGTEIASQAWHRLSGWTRTTYCGGPPGDTMVQRPPTFSSEPPPNQTKAGEKVFGVIVLKAHFLDWFMHERGNLKRAQFTYADDGTLTSSAWVTP